MADSRLLYLNAAVDPTTTFSMTSGTPMTGYPVTHLNSAQRTKITRSVAGTSNIVIVAEFSSRLVKAVGIGDYAGFASGSIAAAWWDAGGGGSFQTFAGGTFPAPSPNRTKLSMLYDPTGVTTTKIRYTFVYGSAGSASISLGLAWISSYLQPSQNVLPGLTLTDVDPSIDVVSEGGQTLTWVRDPYIVMTVQYRPQAQADRDNLREAWRVVGRGAPFIFAAEPSNMDYTIYGRIPARLRSGHLANSLNSWEQPWTIEEVR